MRSASALAARLEVRRRTRDRRRRAASVLDGYDQQVLRVADAEEVEVVAELSVEEYVVAAVAGETAPGWGPEALAAQAVVARSMALAQLVDPRRERFHVVDSDRDCRLVLGDGPADAVRAAAEVTRGRYLSSEPGRRPVPHRALFQASCGGSTDHTDSIWGERMFPTVVADCPHCGRDEVRHWSTRVAEAEAVEVLGLPPFDASTVASLVERTPAGRARTIRVDSEDASGEVLGADVRHLLGHEAIPSTRFEVRVDQPTQVLVLDGTGDGGGVGLCQHGAVGMASEGATHEEILTHFHPAQHLAKIPT
jgi:stage II sporulation protein D